MKHLHAFQYENIQSLINTRQGETKLGESIAKNWHSNTVKFVLLGIEEDIGVRVNKGIGGTSSAWKSFLTAFLNIQSTEFLIGNEVGIFGNFNFEDLKDQIFPETVEIIDEEVSQAIEQIVTEGKIPIVIGGGHNNAFPILKGCSIALKKPINTINLDAHSDFRAKEGRHSGNGFRYAYDAGFLKKYAIIGLHQNYNSQNIVKEIRNNNDIWFCFWEDIFLQETLSFPNAIENAINFTKNVPTGIELDVDCIENTLSSAMTPVGISPTLARQFVYKTAKNTETAYLHLCEGATQLANNEQNRLTGKLLSYLVSDFIKRN